MDAPARTAEAPTTARRRGRSPDETSRLLKEQVYATFTGLAIVAALALDGGHGSAPEAFLTLLAGISGIAAAGFVADVIAHQVGHGRLPDAAEVRTMLRLAGVALATASVPLAALAAAWIGWLDLPLALQVGVGIDFLAIAAIALVAARRTRLPWQQQLIALGGLLGLAALVVLILVIAH